MAENPQIKIAYLAEKFPLVHRIEFQARPKGTAMYLYFTRRADPREEFFEITEEDLRQLVQQAWPNAFPVSSETAVKIYVNGGWWTDADSDDHAASILRQLDLARDQMVVVKDANGQILSRYVSNRNGEIRRLED